MNLRGVYEIFYPRKEKIHPTVWKEKPKYRSKKDFFEEIFPMELRWLNIKIWSDKARRSRFFTDSKAFYFAKSYGDFKNGEQRESDAEKRYFSTGHEPDFLSN